MKLERRYIAHELRVKRDKDAPKIGGYAAKFAPGARSEDLGGFVEELHPNCFNKCLTANPDVRALWNHDANHVLGRTIAGTLRLSVDDTGLQYEVDPPDTTCARDLMVSMERGDVTQSSFGFICTNDQWREDPITGQFIRTVLEAELFDVSPVTYPAYTSATSGVRSLGSEEADKAVKQKVDELRAAKLVREAAAFEAPTSVEENAETPADEICERCKAIYEAREAAAKPEAAVVPAVTERAEEIGDAAQQQDAEATAEAENEQGCSCRCDRCIANRCDECNWENCEDEDCSACPQGAKRSAAAKEVEQREAAELELLQLRLKLAQARSKDF